MRCGQKRWRGLAVAAVIALTGSLIGGRANAAAAASGDRIAAWPASPQLAQATVSPQEIEAGLTLSAIKRRFIQGELTALGYDTGGADGQYGRRTREAIRRYQQDLGRAPTGYLTANLASSLLTGQPPAPGENAALFGTAAAIPPPPPPSPPPLATLRKAYDGVWTGTLNNKPIRLVFRNGQASTKIQTPDVTGAMTFTLDKAGLVHSKGWLTLQSGITRIAFDHEFDGRTIRIDRQLEASTSDGSSSLQKANVPLKLVLTRQGFQ